MVAMKTVHDLETPSILIDLDRMERNIAAMQKRCDDLGIQFRPHIKTHKIPDIARRQLEAGAVGIACFAPRLLAGLLRVCTINSKLFGANLPVRLPFMLERKMFVCTAIYLDRESH